MVVILVIVVIVAKEVTVVIVVAEARAVRGDSKNVPACRHRTVAAAAVVAALIWKAKAVTI